MSGPVPPQPPPAEPAVAPTTKRHHKPAEPPIIEIRGLTVRNGAQTLLDGINLELHAGEILGLVFAQGLGKSTLLRAASGFFRPEAGQVLYKGRDIATFGYEEERAFQRATGFVFQNGGLLVNTKVYDNVALPLRYEPGLSDAQIDAKVRESLATVGMADAADRFPWELTVARQKLCTLARALVREPQLIFFDNFFKGTEPDLWYNLIKLVRQLRNTRHLGWVLVLEADPTVYSIADRLAIIEHGKVLEVSSPNELRKSKDVRITGVFRTIDWSEENG
ncbi:MAG TPA: ATP-binding cassette domain-containing protein [Planctomycetota bacterium]|nr:ATP-binding cassette domain-containing protein [Planctomycetota bacterium]